MTAFASRVQTHRPHLRLSVVVAAAAALCVAGVIGYAIAGGFSGNSTPGGDVSSNVMTVWRTGDTAAINALYVPSVKFVLEYPGRAATEVETTRKQLTDTIKNAIAIGNTYTQIGPVSTYTTADGDTYVASLVEVKGPGHPSGVPVVGFYRVHDGKIVRHIFMDAEHY
jgi:hypothetical protein